MESLTLEPYRSAITVAVQSFWDTRTRQHEAQKLRNTNDTGLRGAATGGQHLNGFVGLLSQIAIDFGIPADCISTKRNNLPGFFRPSKDWDFIILSPDKKLIAVVEFKSQCGPSFSNNFNNRTEEVLGSAVDIWTAFREQSFPNQDAPWLGYLVMVEKAAGSTRPVGVPKTHFPTREEFQGTSYLERYKLLCQKLVLERHYTSAALLWTQPDYSFGDVSEDVSLDAFLRSYMGHLLGHLHLFQP